ncbi:YdcF family protein [Candidatus Beckwithbacteria bacterium]|nr:YdcF family protein [Candidatus Beckwithbacteria bacterium]
MEKSRQNNEEFPIKIRLAITDLWDYLRINDPIKEADAAFIFGEENITPVIKAAELYRLGCVKQLFFNSKKGTFGNPEWQKDEAEIYHYELLKQGVPKSIQHWQGLATNTLEEVQFAIPMMKNAGIDPKNVILIALPIHQRRAWATMQKQNPTIEFINIPSDQQLIINQTTLDRIISEMARFDKYANKGDIIKQKIPKTVEKAWKTILPYAKNPR